MRIRDCSSDVCSSDLVEKQTHGRFLKTHLPVDALVFSPKARYIYIGRDGRDVAWSMYNHHANANHLWYEALNDTPGRVGPPIEPPPDSVRQYFHDWLTRDGFPFWPFRSEEHTSELQSLMRISYAVFCLKKKKNNHTSYSSITIHTLY